MPAWLLPTLALADLPDLAPDDPPETAARLRHASLDELAGEPWWPNWADSLARERAVALLPPRCADPALRTLALPVDLVIEACAASLSPTALAEALARGPTPSTRARAAELLAGLSDPRPADVGDAVVWAFSWTREPLAGTEGLLDKITLPEGPRRRLATELVTRRVQVTLTGDQTLPERLSPELESLLAPEIARFGAPTHTIDWLHLLAAAGGDPERVLVRLNLRTDHHWSVVLDENETLTKHPQRAWPLLGHRSPIVRERAAARLERAPTASVAALRRSWRFLPGRSPPLRGDIGVPDLPRSEAAAERWALRLSHWARRCSRQSDDTALRATLRLLSAPGTSNALTDTALNRTAESLLRTARRDPSPERKRDLAQGMDAVLRGVPFVDGERPAPEQAGEASSWTRLEIDGEGDVTRGR